jgi:hypothetical protein
MGIVPENSKSLLLSSKTGISSRKVKFIQGFVTRNQVEKFKELRKARVV